MTYELMALKVIGNVHCRTKFLARVAKFLYTESMRTLETSLIRCHYGYASISWFSGVSQNLKDKLQTTQNKLMRIILKLSHWDAHWELSWLPVDLVVLQIKMLMVFKVRHDLAPSYLSGYFNFSRLS
ncbi:unnamed protein product [Coregonus sp. 'balchen']|nr:unnamed protein product [Coregonus sp. 'balchen']